MLWIEFVFVIEAFSPDGHTIVDLVEDWIPHLGEGIKNPLLGGVDDSTPKNPAITDGVKCVRLSWI